MVIINDTRDSKLLLTIDRQNNILIRRLKCLYCNL